MPIAWKIVFYYPYQKVGKKLVYSSFLRSKQKILKFSLYDFYFYEELYSPRVYHLFVE